MKWKRFRVSIDVRFRRDGSFNAKTLIAKAGTEAEGTPDAALLLMGMALALASTCKASPLGYEATEEAILKDARMMARRLRQR